VGLNTVLIIISGFLISGGAFMAIWAHVRGSSSAVITHPHRWALLAVVGAMGCALLIG
jgi:hypothetical protein